MKTKLMIVALFASVAMVSFGAKKATVKGKVGTETCCKKDSTATCTSKAEGCAKKGESLKKTK